ncbi:hypothetical protein [Spongiivirga citrea]|uniref:Uncharacterized protein n=1 Tax=Spongiivirga citrea TaxID=1481457 RepID=A0A6M0CUA6_9FLAO|nr:hypothetical protein [Spongiivirga citrea]NER19077.1 hypothetical protein [Spongiivirga citrea]
MKKFKTVTSCLALIFFLQQTEAQESTDKEWTAVSQYINVNEYIGKEFRLSADAKVDLHDSNPWAGVWARVDLSNGKIGFFENMGQNPIVENRWKRYSISGTIDKEGTHLFFGAVVGGSGTFWFDNFQLEILVNGDWIEIPVENAQFEKEANDNVMPKWVEGIRFFDIWRATNYEISSSTETNMNKGFSLQIRSQK